MKGYPNCLTLKPRGRISSRQSQRHPWEEITMARGRKSSLHIVLSARGTRPRWNTGSVPPRLPPGSRGGGESSSCWPLGSPNPTWANWSGSNGPSCASGPGAFLRNASQGWLMPWAAGPRAFFPPEVAIHVVRLACERPDMLGRSLSQWDCHELARQLIAEGIVADISAATVRRILRSHKLKPWRSSSLALPQEASGRRVLCHGLRAHRSLHPPAACG